jgi:FAD/FMN-containing dehydrogenase
MSTIGVSGLLLGGGISYFANKMGWACDNVVSYEVVTASGIIVTASPTQYSDLYWALRGGGNNFGVVTKFNVNAFPNGNMWGARLFSPDQFSKALDAVYNFAYNSASDLEAAMILVSHTSPMVRVQDESKM